jgi:hypothetical protein
MQLDGAQAVFKLRKYSPRRAGGLRLAQVVCKARRLKIHAAQVP